MHWDFKKITTAVLTTLGIGTLTSCYGMPPVNYGSEWSATIYGGKDTELPLNNIHVRLISGREIIAEDWTDSTGFVSLQMDPGRTAFMMPEDGSRCMELIITDDDGTQNGGKFKSFTKQIYFDENNTDYEEIFLEKDE